MFRLVFALALIGAGWSEAAANAPPPAARDLMLQYPGLRVYSDGSRVSAIYGKPMTPSATPTQAAELWWQQHANAFGVPSLSLRVVRENRVGWVGEFSVFAYEQSIDGIPVEGGLARLLVRNGPPNAVVYAGAKLARVPDGGFLPDKVDGASARASVQALPAYSHLPQWTQPELAIFNGESNDGPGPAIRAWRFQGREPGVASLVRYTFFVDAANGRLAHVRDDVYDDTDVYGHVSGMGTPGVLPDVNYNPPIEMDMSEIEVRIQGGAADFADRDGNYVLTNDNPDPVTVETDLYGRWVRVSNQAGENLFLEQTVTPPGPADFLFNDTPEEFTTAQVNGFLLTILAHNFFKDRQPDFPGLDILLPCLVNQAGSCDAFFNGTSIIFLRSGPVPGVPELECVNMCYSTVAAHEYGHFVHSRHGLGGGAFGEGFADTYAMLIFDSPLMGEDIVGPSTSGRDYTCGDVQYPCQGAEPPCGTEVFQNNAIHGCGKLLGGVWWKIKLNMQETMGAEAGLQYARQLFTDWTGITIGGQGLNSAHPQTAIEVLTVDDDDGNLRNGTPHFAEIYAAFAAHSIPVAVPGDLDGDGDVDLSDLAELLAAYGACEGDPEYNPDADFDGNGCVDLSDLAVLLTYYGLGV